MHLQEDLIELSADAGRCRRPTVRYLLLQGAPKRKRAVFIRN